MGTSDVCGTGWYGAVVHYKSYKHATVSNYANYHVTDGTTGDGVFFNETHVSLNNKKTYGNCNLPFFQLIVTDDSKHLKLLSLPEDETEKLMIVKDAFETEGIIEGLAVWNDHSKVAVSYDSSISTLELSSNCAFSLLNTYQ